MIRQRQRVAPEPEPQLSLREEIALYKAKLRQVKAQREAALKSVHESQSVIKPKKRSKKRQEHVKPCFKSIHNYFKTLYHELFSGFKRKSYLCMGTLCCMSSEMRVFVNEEFPTSPPIV